MLLCVFLKSLVCGVVVVFSEDVVEDKLCVLLGTQNVRLVIIFFFCSVIAGTNKQELGCVRVKSECVNSPFLSGTDPSAFLSRKK